MKYNNAGLIAVCIVSVVCLLGCKNSSTSPKNVSNNNEFIVELPQVSYPLPVVDYITNNGDKVKKRNINDNPVVYILRGINDIWKGTTDTYQNASSKNGPGKEDYEKGNPIIDSVVWKQNIQYVIKVTQNRTDDETILAYLDENRAKYYSITDGFGPLTEDYVKNSGVYVDLPAIKVEQVLHDIHYKCEYNDGSKYAGSETSTLGAVVKLAKDFRNNCSSTNAPKYLYSTPRPWRMDDCGAVTFLGTTYDITTQKPTYSCIDYNGKEIFKIFDKYESSVIIIPGVVCSRKNHKKIYDDNNPSLKDLYSNTTENRRTDNGYPSGHTNAGVLVSLAYAYACPERFQEMVFRGAQLGEDRIVAGMHSPVDVIGGKVMALSIACAALNSPNVAKDAEEAVASMQKFFGAKADSVNMSLFDYAHRKVEDQKGYTIGKNVNIEVFNNNIYDDRAKIKKLYRERLTYGFVQDKAKIGQAPIVPKGAEAILKSRFPYLSNNQRRGVLYTTEIPSGYKIVDKTNGWGRIDLVTAADGYGSFIGDVIVNMDASLGGFNALDYWRNNIYGQGRLIKCGTGMLVLTGNNSYTGGTVIKNGILTVFSNTALGDGNVSVEEKGTLEVTQSLSLNGNLKQSGGTIIAHIDSDSRALISTKKQVILRGNLVVNFGENVQPKAGDKFAIIKGMEVVGNFNNVRAEGYNLSCEKINNTVYILVHKIDN